MKIKQLIWFITFGLILTGIIFSCQNNPEESEDSGDQDLTSKVIGIWKYKVDLDGTTYATNDAGYTAASGDVTSFKFEANDITYEGEYDGATFTTQTDFLTGLTWMISGTTVNLSYTYVNDGNDYEDTLAVTFENNYNNAVCLVTATTNPNFTANQTQIYMVKQN